MTGIELTDEELRGVALTSVESTMESLRYQRGMREKIIALLGASQQYAPALKLALEINEADIAKLRVRLWGF